MKENRKKREEMKERRKERRKEITREKMKTRSGLIEYCDCVYEKALHCSVIISKLLLQINYN